jgi:hypothetical protein
MDLQIKIPDNKIQVYSIKRNSNIWRNQNILFVEVKTNTAKWNFSYFTNLYTDLQTYYKILYFIITAP